MKAKIMIASIVLLLTLGTSAYALEMRLAACCYNHDYCDATIHVSYRDCDDIIDGKGNYCVALNILTSQQMILNCSSFK